MTDHDMCCGSCADFKPFHGDQFEVWSAGECDRTGNTLTEHDLSEMRCCWREKNEVFEKKALIIANEVLSQCLKKSRFTEGGSTGYDNVSHSDLHRSVIILGKMLKKYDHEGEEETENAIR